MPEPRVLDQVPTPAAVVDLARMRANLDRMAGYAKERSLALRPHTKTHKSPELAREQLRRGATGVTVATVREAEVMASVCDDILLAHPPVGPGKVERLLALPPHVRITVALDSQDALESVARAAARAGREVGVLVELDLGMHRVGVQEPAAAAALARLARDLDGVAWRGITFYPGHVREPVDEQASALGRLHDDLGLFIDALDRDHLSPVTVSGGSTPTAFASHTVGHLTEIRPGTYIFNDRTTAEMGACAWEDCAYTVLATVVSTAVRGQAVVDAGSKALTREELRAPGGGFGALADRREVTVKGLSEEHGLLDLARTDWRPRIGERVRIVPNHVCVSVNLHDRVRGVEGDEIVTSWSVAARGWAP
jgi:D-serine deaminase-like pyridoxal phosphate-dependent protein